MFEPDVLLGLARRSVVAVTGLFTRDPLYLACALPMGLALMSRDPVAVTAAGAALAGSVIALVGGQEIGVAAAVGLTVLGTILSLSGLQHARARRRIIHLERKQLELEARVIRLQERDVVRRVQTSE